MGCSASHVVRLVASGNDADTNASWVSSSWSSGNKKKRLSKQASIDGSTHPSRSLWADGGEEGKQNAEMRLRRCSQWYDALCAEGADVVDVAAFVNSKIAAEASKSGLRVVKLIGHECDAELERDRRDTGHSAVFVAGDGKVVEFPAFVSKVQWWSDASLEEKLDKAFTLFFGASGVASTKEDVIFLLDSILPSASRHVLSDIAKSIILSAQIETILVQGKHKSEEGVSRKEFVDWMWRCQFQARHGCDKDMLTVDFQGEKRASREGRNSLQRDSNKPKKQLMRIKVSQASMSAGTNDSKIDGNAAVIDEEVPDTDAGGLSPQRMISQRSNKTRRSSNTTMSGSRVTGKPSSMTQSSRRGSRKSISSQRTQRGSIVVQASSVITEDMGTAFTAPRL